MEFQAEVRSTSSRKLISNDVEYKVVLVGSNPAILDLGKLDAETLLNVTIEIEKNTIS